MALSKEKYQADELGHPKCNNLTLGTIGNYKTGKGYFICEDCYMLVLPNSEFKKLVDVECP